MATPSGPRLTARRRKEIASLSRKKYRERLGQTLVEGLRGVSAAAGAGVEMAEVLVAMSVWDDPAVRGVAERAGAPIIAVPDDELARLSDVETSQGILAVVRTAWVDHTRLAACRSVLALDAVQDPGNAGTLLRTAAWFGVDAVLAGPGTVDLVSPKVVRASMGGVWDVALARSEDLARSLDTLRSHGFHCYGADLVGGSAAVWRPIAPAVLVLGSEAHGLSEAVRATLHTTVAITSQTTPSATESLNVAVAGALLLYEWLGRA